DNVLLEIGMFLAYFGKRRTGIIRVKDGDRVASLPSDLKGITTLVFVILILTLAVILLKFANWVLWENDKITLREEIIIHPSRLKILVKQNSEAALKHLETKAECNLWKLIFLSSYISILETRIRQETLAPALLIETPLKWSSQYFQTPSSIYPQFTNEENELLLEILQKETSYSRFLQVQKWILRRWPFRKETPLVYYLIKGISEKDYRRGQTSKLAKWLKLLTENDDSSSALFDEESIKSILRLADKQHDFQLGEEPFEDLKGERNWIISWSEGSQGITLTNDVKIPLFELNNCNTVSVELGYNSPQSSYENTDSSIILSGYRIIPKQYEPSMKFIENIRLKERVATFEKLERRHREVLKDLLCGGFQGSVVRLLDTSNIMMAFQTYVRRQYTLNKITEAIKNGSDTSSLQQVLLRVNVLSQTIPCKSIIDEMNLGYTLSTSGIIGLKSIPKNIRKSLVDYCKNLGITVGENEDREDVPSVTAMSIPQLTEYLGLQETRRTERLARKRTIGWAATGGGAWILKEDLLESFTEEIKDAPIQNWYVLFHHPLRERVFLEILTHKNYHYLSEIIKNRIQFQKEISRKNLQHLELIWSREAFHPSSNHIILDNSAREILDELISVHKIESSSDSCFMLTKSNMLIRNPVSGLNLLLAENSHSLSPISAYCHDMTLRQRAYEMVADCISEEKGLVESDKPTSLSLMVNWLGPLDIDEEIDSVIRFDKHCFSNPESWYQLGFLELIVKEVKCAYSILKIIDWYSNCLRNDTSLPFKVTQSEPRTRIEDDIRDLDEAFDSLCDFLSGEGDFKLEGVTAVSGENGYLDWLKKALEQLPEIGRSLGSETEFK
ncbi:MAG: TIR domain-containing protein, partial [Candidatus Thorarchaeota archaeon]